MENQHEYWNWTTFSERVLTRRPDMNADLSTLHDKLMSERDTGKKEALRHFTGRDVSLRQEGNQLFFEWQDAKGKRHTLQVMTPIPEPEAPFDLFDDPEPSPTALADSPSTVETPPTEPTPSDPLEELDEPQSEDDEEEGDEAAAEEDAAESVDESEGDESEDEPDDEPDDDTPAPAVAQEPAAEGPGLFAALAGTLLKKHDAAILTVARDGETLFISFKTVSGDKEDAAHDRAFAVSGTVAELEDPQDGFASFLLQARESRKTLAQLRKELAEVNKLEAEAVKAKTEAAKEKVSKKLAKVESAPSKTTPVKEEKEKPKPEVTGTLFDQLA